MTYVFLPPSKGDFDALAWIVVGGAELFTSWKSRSGTYKNNFSLFGITKARPKNPEGLLRIPR